MLTLVVLQCWKEIIQCSFWTMVQLSLKWGIQCSWRRTFFFGIIQSISRPGSISVGYLDSLFVPLLLTELLGNSQNHWFETKSEKKNILGYFKNKERFCWNVKMDGICVSAMLFCSWFFCSLFCPWLFLLWCRYVQQLLVSIYALHILLMFFFIALFARWSIVFI